ncbi:heme exporter protein CcmB, partial [Salmonella enterica]|uniref:heme exporter protein CcmB n=1 Tax=Salmonella enterica TaxID=28901 RepID=UPI000B24B5B9
TQRQHQNAQQDAAAPGVALTAGLRRGGVLLGILVLPLSVPVLIFATAAALRISTQ